MARLAISEARGALKTLSDTLTYYDTQQSGLGARFLRSYDAYLDKLRDMPQIGRAGRVFGTRELIMQDFPFLIVYRVRQEYVQILRLIHQSMKYP